MVTKSKVKCIKSCKNISTNPIMMCCNNSWYEAERIIYGGSVRNIYHIFKGNLFIGMFEMENFITMAEYREEQINSILND